MDFREFHVFNKHQIFPTDRKSEEYKEINTIRTRLLKINAKEASNYLNQNLRINSQTTKDYLTKSFENITINLKTKQIQSSKKTRVSFIHNLEDIDIQPFIHKCNHHYHKFQNRKKVVLAKHGNHFLKKNSIDSDLFSEHSYHNNHSHSHNHNHNHNNNYENSPHTEELLYLLTGKIDQKTYFNYLHSLFYSLHKNILQIKNKKKKKIKSHCNNSNNISLLNEEKNIVSRKSSPSIIKVKNKLINENNTINIEKKLKKCNSNENIFGIIKLVQCQEK